MTTPKARQRNKSQRRFWARCVSSSFLPPFTQKAIGRTRRSYDAAAAVKYSTTCFVALGLPNESRLSCGAELEDSQTEFYNTGRRDVMRMRWERAPPASSAC